MMRLLFIGLAGILFTGCTLEDSGNKYDPLIPPYEFPDTCQGTFYNKLYNYPFEASVFSAPNSGLYILSYTEVKRIDSLGNELWTFPANWGTRSAKGSDQSVFFASYESNQTFVNKVDSSGNHLWKYHVSGIGRIEPALNGGCMAFTSTTEVRRINEGGWLVWLADFSNKASNVSFAAPTPDDGAIIAGDTVEQYTVNDIIYAKYPHKIFRLDNQGTVVWELKIDYGNSHYESGRGIIMNNGYFYYWVSGPDNFTTYEIDDNGQLLDMKTIPGTEYVTAQHFAAAADGGFLITGTEQVEGDIAVFKLNSSLNEEWRRTFGGLNKDFGIRTEQTVQGNLLVIGDARGFDGTSRDIISKIYLVKTDIAGNTCY